MLTVIAGCWMVGFGIAMVYQSYSIFMDLPTIQSPH
jgi:hypothetical protein